MGVIFVVLLFSAGGMASVPTGDDPGTKILAFYAAPLGFTGLDAVAPLTILAFVVALSVSMLREPVAEQ